MKQFFSMTLALCLLFSMALGFSGTASAESVEENTEEAVEEPVEETVAVPRLDYEAIYALHEPDEVVMTVGEQEITWGEYFYYFYRQAASVESYFDSMAMYGTSCNWDDAIEEGGSETYADFVLAGAAQTALSIRALGGFVEENGFTLDDEGRAAIAEKEAEDIAAVLGEDGTREELEAFLQEMYMPVAVYDYMNEVSALYQQGFRERYGENGEKLSDEDALAWMEAQGYMAANHILLLTMDMATYQALDDEVKAEKLAKAQSIAEELHAIEEQDALLARFAALKEEFDEDTGKVAYPDGYVFTPGTMVSEFEEATRSQEPYQVSDPVESTYGYHVIMTMPLNPNAVLQYSSAGTPQTARALAANDLYADAVDTYAQTLELTWLEGYEAPDLLAFVK